MVRFSDEWLESEEFKRHMDKVLHGCSEAGRAMFLAGKLEAYKGGSLEERQHLFEFESRMLSDAERSRARPLKPGELRRNMERMLHQWEHGVYQGEMYYSGGPEQLRRDIRDGAFG